MMPPGKQIEGQQKQTHKEKTKKERSREGEKKKRKEHTSLMHDGRYYSSAAYRAGMIKMKNAFLIPGNHSSSAVDKLIIEKYCWVRLERMRPADDKRQKKTRPPPCVCLWSH